MSDKLSEDIVNILISVSSLLYEILKNDKQTENTFNSKIIPNISIESYLSRLVKYSNIEESTTIVMLIYIDKLCQMNDLYLNNYNIHR
jgi:hypothetical protein